MILLLFSIFSHIVLASFGGVDEKEHLSNPVLLVPGWVALPLEDNLNQQYTLSSSLAFSKGFQYRICNAESNTFHLDTLEITPDPPVKGKELIVMVEGSLDTEISQGSSMDIVVKFNRITLLKRRLDFCDELENASGSPVKCPIAAGPKKWIIHVDLPSQIPSGRYSADIQLTDQKNRSAFCAQAKILLQS